MKKILMFLLLGISAYSFGQVSISQLPLYTGSSTGTIVPIVTGGVTKRMDGSKLGQISDSTKIPYLAKGNKFTGNDTFPTIAVLNNSYAAGIKTSGDTTIIGDVLNADNGTKLTVNDDLDEVVINGGLGFTSGQKITSISTDTAFTANSNSVLSTQAAVKAYVANHSSGGSFIDTTKIPYLAKNNVFTGDNNFSSIEALSLQASSFINLGGYGVNAFSNDTSLSSSPLYSLPTQNAVKAYVANHANSSNGIDSNRLAFLAKNNKFTGNDTFPTIAVLNNSYAAGIKTHGDTTTIGDIQGANNGTTLTVNDDLDEVIINGGLGFTSGQKITSISTDTAFTANSNSVLSTQAAVKAYVTNHAPNLSGYQVTSNLSNDGTMAANSSTLYPTQQATRTYTAGLVVGLLNDRGSYNASSNIYPSTGGSGTAGAIMKGDLWYINTSGTLGGTSVVVGSSVRALTNSPGQTSSNWDILNVGLGYTPENVLNKSTSVVSDSGSTTKYPTVQSVGRYAQSLSNLSNNVISDSASTTKYPSVQAITRFVKANSISYTDTVITLSGTSTTTSKYTFVKPTNSGYLLYTNPNPTIGETDYIYNITGAYSLNKSFYLRSNTGTYFYATASSGSYTSAITVDSGRQVRLQYVGNGEWLYTVQNQGLIPQDVANLSNDITADSASTTKYPSVNAVKRYVQANSGGLPYKVYSALLTQQGGEQPPSVTVLQNTIGTITWSRLQAGIYVANSSEGIFSNLKTWSPQNNVLIQGNGIPYSILNIYRTTDNTVYVETDNSSNSPTEGQLTYQYIEIRVYP